MWWIRQIGIIGKANLFDGRKPIVVIDDLNVSAMANVVIKVSRLCDPLCAAIRVDFLLFDIVEQQRIEFVHRIPVDDQPNSSILGIQLVMNTLGRQHERGGTQHTVQPFAKESAVRRTSTSERICVVLNVSGLCNIGRERFSGAIPT